MFFESRKPNFISSESARSERLRVEPVEKFSDAGFPTGNGVTDAPAGAEALRRWIESQGAA
jgi:hypothetical protein